MTARLKNWWLWVGTVWAGALLMFLWNHATIETILALQAQNHDLRSELTFQQQNAPKLERIQNEHAKLFLAAESLQLGVLSAKGLLGELASRSELNVGQLTSTPLQKGVEAAALNLTFSGPPERVLQFMAALNTHRYLQQKQLAVKFDPKSGEATCELSMQLRCRIQAPALNEPNPNAPNARAAL
jgi:hypothetical protein